MTLRRMSVGGRWYPGDSTALAAEVDAYIAAAEDDVPALRPIALIAPHAGLMYSGPVAAYAYRLTKNAQYRSVVMIGPSHFVPFAGVALWPDGSWETPFGPVKVDRELAAAIRVESAGVLEQPAAHGREHSLEMQMPFIARLMPGVSIVPLVMGHQTAATAFETAEALARAIAPRRDEVLLVASSDLSHYENAQTAAALDATVLHHVSQMDSEGLMATLEREPRHACGGGPMVTVLEAARQLGATHARVLRYGDSGDVSGDKSSVVGYLAAAIW